jgi:hypothetical protein
MESSFLSEVTGTSNLRTVSLSLSTGYVAFGSCARFSGLSRSEFVLWHRPEIHAATAT